MDIFSVILLLAIIGLGVFQKRMDDMLIRHTRNMNSMDYLIYTIFVMIVLILAVIKVFKW